MKQNEYHNETKNGYKDIATAIQYDQGVKGGGTWKLLRFKIISRLERAAYSKALKMIPKSAKKTIIDAPCGTGKLADIITQESNTIFAMDISKAMLDIAKKKYNKYNNAVNFEIQDFEIPFSNKNIIPNETTIACLRLMHRVPLANRKIILRNFLKYSKYLIVSYAINSKYHIIRRWLRNMLFSTTPVPLSLSKHKEINKELTNSGYKVLCEISVNKLLSEQVVFICKANKI